MEVMLLLLLMLSVGNGLPNVLTAVVWLVEKPWLDLLARVRLTERTVDVPPRRRRWDGVGRGRRT